MSARTIQLFAALLILSLPAWAEHSNSLSGSSGGGAVETGKKVRSEMESRTKDFSSAVSKLVSDAQKTSTQSASSGGENYNSLLSSLSGGARAATSSTGTTATDLANGYELLGNTAAAGFRLEAEAVLNAVDAANAAAAEYVAPATGREKLEAAGRKSSKADPLGIVMAAIDDKNAEDSKPALVSGTASAGSALDHSATRTSTTPRRGVSSVGLGIEERAYNVPEGFRP